ncbi:MAG: hypothetical protein V7K38_17550 [Nostoc sp.]|uniref:hypothetical protein n=1 Tax=Nostoc sp. TaxID=1180 RepID=UPI002FFABEBB
MSTKSGHTRSQYCPFDRKARRVFAKKELDVSDEELNEIEQQEDLMAEAIEDEIDDKS